MFRYLTLAATFVGTAATAQMDFTTGNAAADELIATALAEHRLFLTCSSLDASVYELVSTTWIEMVTQAATILRDNDIPEKTVGAFEKAALIENLLPVEGTSYADVKAFCDETSDWQTTYYRLNIVLLDMQLQRAF